MRTLTHTHPFNGPLSGTTWVSRYQKGKTNLDFNEPRDSERQWHQLGHMQICTSLQTDNHASTPPLSFYRPDALPAAQPTASKHWRQLNTGTKVGLNADWRAGCEQTEHSLLTHLTRFDGRARQGKILCYHGLAVSVSVAGDGGAQQIGLMV